MPINHLLPFALPTGRSGETGRLTVYFSPRLKERARLFRYQAWEDWPQTLNGLTLEIAVNGTVLPHRVVSPPASSAVWRAVFSPQTPVAPHRFVDFTETPLLPMASSDFSEAILNLYLSLARLHPDGPPSGSDLVGLAAAAGLDLGTAEEPGSLAEAAAYRAPMVDAVDLDEPIEAPRFDFHAAVSLLGHHPELLRHLGLAVDVELDDLPSDPSQVRVTANFSGGQAAEAKLVTRTTKDFLALTNPNSPEQSQGFLTLAAEKAFLSIVDPNQAASRLTATTDLAVQQDDGVLPALATRALSLVRPDLTTTYVNRFVRQAELEAQLPDALTAGGDPVVLFAEDLTIGHRFDVLDSGVWRSLFERHSDTGYAFPAAPDRPAIVPAPDEGWNTTLLLTEQSDVRPQPDPDRDDPILPTALFRLDDAVYRWNGWSGAAPAPSTVLDSSTGQPKVVEPNEPTEEVSAQVAVDYQVVPGSLPRLRFGRTYQMRARCVDLAGNSQPLSAIEKGDHVVPPEPFGRLEPIAAPIVARRSPRPTPGIGDTPEELVLLSDVGIPDDQVTPVDRLLFPGRVGQDLCELHGLPEGGADPDSYTELAVRDALDLADQTVVDPVTGEVLAGIESKGGIEPGATRQDVGYLSDPAIGGVRFGFPSLGTEATLSGLPDWPARQSVRLVVAAGDEAPQVRPDEETDLLVSVPKAEIVPVAASFAIAPEFLDHFALWQRFTAGEQSELEAAVVGGVHWMFTPARSLRLVHAVRRPLLAPVVVELTEQRSLGSSAVVLKGELTVHNNSTERVSMTASWTDTVDDLTQTAPVPRSTSVELGNLLVTRSDDNLHSFRKLRAELHDTKRHLATVDLEAFSSFASYFTEQKSITVSRRPVVLDPRGVVAGTVEVTASATGEKARSGVDFIVDGPAGTLTVLGRGKLVVGEDLVVRYVALPISRRSTEPKQPEAFPMLFRNTAVPPPPVVNEVIPAFARTADGAHSGQVLRVYLDRPWLVTGDGEQLAVVLHPTSSSATVVGRDPVVPGVARSLDLTTASFPRASAVVSAVDGVHDIAVHEVSFDGASGRWYADIELGPGFGYRPFLRLTLARFQPDSISGAALSSFVTVDPVRLGVVRQTSVTRTKDSVEILVSGVDELGNAMQVTVEGVEKSIPDLDLRWQPLGDPVRLNRSAVGDEVTWKGVLDLPAADSLRVVIEELEPGQQTDGRTVIPVETVVFVEVVELPPA